MLNTADNHGCRFWNIFTGLAILHMCTAQTTALSLD